MDKKSIGGRIIGGKFASKPVPWQVHITYRGFIRCGGTLIDQTTIITAGHCSIYTDEQGSPVDMEFHLVLKMLILHTSILREELNQIKSLFILNSIRQ